MMDDINDELVSRERWKALLATPAGQRATLAMLMRYVEGDEAAGEVASMTDHEVIMAMRRFNRVGARR